MRRPPGGAAGRRAASASAVLLALAFPPRSVVAQDAVIARVDSATLRLIARSPLLDRQISVQFAGVSIESAVREVALRAGLRLSYSSDFIPPGRTVTMAREHVHAGDLLREILRETALDVVVSPSGYVVLVHSPSRTAIETDAMSPGDSTHPAPSIGMLARSAVRPQLMDRVLVMGTPFSGAPERGMASAVSVLTSSQIAQSGLTNMQQIFRTGIPGVVSWDLGISGPFSQIGSVRGSSSFTSNYLKTYVDGVELASPYLLFAIDPFSVERIEVIRGPQGSALYGSDAISGVVQVVTRSGSPAAHWHPQVDASLSAGRMESRYTDGGTLRQRHSGMLLSGGGMTSVGIGGTYEDVGAIVDGGSSGYRGTFGGVRQVWGPLRLDGTMRYADVRFTSPANPLLRDRALSDDVRPLLEPQRIENETYGLTADFQPSTWWRQTIVVGLDRHAGAIPPQREPATVADALLGATSERVGRTSVRYSMAARVLSIPGATITATAGAEGSRLERQRLGFRSDLAGSGTGIASLYTDDVHNTGIFGQLKLDLANSLFLSGGLRGEQNTSFGENFGTAYAPMLGAAFTRDVGSATIKLRAAYGKGIRPPAPSARWAIQTVGFRQLENPDLRPEIQAGTEAGFELYLGDRATLSFTTYNQNAQGLIQQVIPSLNTENARTIQYQNVGHIQNTGVELEGNVRVGQVRGDATFSLTDSRVRALAATYTGDLRVGDRVPEVPTSSGLASLTWDTGRLRTTMGTSYIGRWTGYDWLGFYGGDSASTTAHSSLRSYWMSYPSLIKPFAGFAMTVARGAEWYVRVDNLTNVQRNERDDLQITAGRTASFGLRIQH